MVAKNKCSNMNHGRMNVSIRFCTDCGEILNSSIKNVCNEEMHNARRKNRNTYCHDCGKKLTPGPLVRN